MLESIRVKSISDVHLTPFPKSSVPVGPTEPWAVPKAQVDPSHCQSTAALGKGNWTQEKSTSTMDATFPLPWKPFHTDQWKQLPHCSLTPLTQDLEWELFVFLNSATRTTALTLLPLSDEALHCNSYQILKYPPKNQGKELLPWSRLDSILTLTVVFLFCQITQQNRQGCPSAALKQWGETDWWHLLLTSTTKASTGSSALSLSWRKLPQTF